MCPPKTRKVRTNKPPPEPEKPPTEVSFDNSDDDRRKRGKSGRNSVSSLLISIPRSQSGSSRLRIGG